jgi:hypothetical protein
MQIVHFALVRAPELKKARAVGLQAVGRYKHAVNVVDRRIPSGRAAAYVSSNPEFHQIILHLRMMQGSSLLSVYTMLANIYGLATAKDFEEKYLHNPDEFKKIFVDSFKFMGECAADVLLDRRCPVAIPGEDWHRGDFDHEGFMSGLDTMCQLKKLLRGEYFSESYFLNAVDDSALIPDDATLNEMARVAKAEGEVLALVPVRVEH